MVLFSLFLSFRAKRSSLSKILPAEELTPPASQDSASSDSSFRLELLPSQESVASDSPVESEQNASSHSEQNVSSCLEPTVSPIVSLCNRSLVSSQSIKKDRNHGRNSDSFRQR